MALQHRAVFGRLFQDHDSHGPEFLKHMRRLNELTGANITVRFCSVSCFILPAAALCLARCSIVT